MSSKTIPPSTAPPRQITNNNTTKKTYLTSLNILNATLWFIILIKTIKINLHLPSKLQLPLSVTPPPTSSPSSQPAAYTTVYAHIGQFTKWTQTLIILDAIHTLLGIIRTNLLTVIFQAGSRLLLVWLIADTFEAPRESIWYSTMLVSWSLADFTRYLYHVYAAGGVSGNGNGEVPRWLSWARYNFFFVLYLTGAGSEWMCMFKSLPEAKQLGGAYYYLILGSLVVWPLLFPSLYMHMIAQRRKMMRGKKKQT